MILIKILLFGRSRYRQDDPLDLFPDRQESLVTGNTGGSLWKPGSPVTGDPARGPGRAWAEPCRIFLF